MRISLTQSIVTALAYIARAVKNIYPIRLAPSLVLLAAISGGLFACSASPNISVGFTNGACANGESYAPYCVAVEVQNNSSGQNYITNSSAPISNLQVSIAGVNNVLSPATSSAMDPNHCTSSTINAGANCTFYLQLNKETYAVNRAESVTLTLNYTINNTLFGGGGSASNSFNLNEFTNLYIVESANINNGATWLWQYNGTGLRNVGLIESGDLPLSFTLDNNSYGYLYLGGNLGIYAYPSESNVSSRSISGSNIGGASNLLANGSLLYAASISNGIWSYSFANESFSANALYTFVGSFANNVSTLSTSTTLYFASGGLVYACNVPNSSACQNEGNSGSLTGNVIGLKFLSAVGGYTGLYALTTTGVFAESGVGASSANTWSRLTQSGGSDFLGITSGAVASNESGAVALYLGSSTGVVYRVEATAPTTAYQYSVGAALGEPINAMVVDNIGQVLYFTTANNNLYACLLGSSSCTPTLLGQSGGYSMLGLGIGSVLLGS